MLVFRDAVLCWCYVSVLCAGVMWWFSVLSVWVALSVLVLCVDCSVLVFWAGVRCWMCVRLFCAGCMCWCSVLASCVGVKCAGVLCWCYV